MYLKTQLMIYKSCVLFLQNKQYPLALDLNCDMNENPKHIVGGTRSLVPFPADQQVLSFNLKNGFQKYELRNSAVHGSEAE